MVLQNKSCSINVKICNSFFSKLIGFMFQEKKDYAIYLKNCNNIHTFFCFFPLDVYLLDKDNNIIYTYKNIKSNKIIGPKKNACHILEVPSNLINDFTIKDD